eukprot:1161210-Pelagomonas_calceolata.AAC.13
MEVIIKKGGKRTEGRTRPLVRKVVLHLGQDGHVVPDAHELQLRDVYFHDLHAHALQIKAKHGGEHQALLEVSAWMCTSLISMSMPCSAKQPSKSEGSRKWHLSCSLKPKVKRMHL